VSGQEQERLQLVCGKMKMLRSKSLKTARSWTVKLRPLARYTEDGQKKTDIHNPDPVKRERPLIGLVVMKGVSLNGPHKWDGGTAYDPKTGTPIRSALNTTAATPWK
jgi:hypothetical protein